MVRFKMVGRDVDSIPTQYRTWVVDDQPDFAGDFYTGLKSGDNPFIDVFAYAIFDDSLPVDYNLPSPLLWETSRRVLPDAVSHSHLAINDGYVYLFGGQGSDHILRAALDKPAEWEDTGALLPNQVYSGQLSVIDGYIYIFGGNDGYSATDTIFSAPVSDPLTWTDHGSLLPKKLYGSQLGIVDGYVYLFGGFDTTAPTRTILRATADDPLTWVDTGFILPTAVYNSQLAIMDGYIHLLGGQVSSYNSTNLIWRAHTDDPLTWNLFAALPYAASGGQFVAVGSKGYLISPTASTSTPRVSFTRILRCDLDEPGLWIDMLKTVPGTIAYGQLAVIYDRLFLFGGSGSSVIFANGYDIKYNPLSPAPFAYGNITRTQYQDTPDQLDLFRLLGFPPWKTNYSS
jgi:hypothetical protein